jgi:hypothetical protein
MVAKAEAAGWPETDPAEQADKILAEAAGVAPAAAGAVEAAPVEAAPLPAPVEHDGDRGLREERVAATMAYAAELGLGLADLAAAAGFQLKAAKQPARVRKPAAPSAAKASRYAVASEALASGALPADPPVVTSAANKHYQKHFDRLHGFAVAGDWGAVRDYPVTGSNSYAKLVARYRQDLLTLAAAQAAAAECCGQIPDQDPRRSFAVARTA